MDKGRRSAILRAFQPSEYQECFQLSTSYGGVLSFDLDGTTLPPAGSPNYMLNFGSNSLNEWKFHVDFANPANASLSGPFTLAVSPFTTACNGGTCIPQPGTSNRLDSLADRLMYRLAYRNLGSHESLVVNQTVKVSGNTRSQVDGVRRLDPAGSVHGARLDGDHHRVPRRGRRRRLRRSRPRGGVGGSGPRPPPLAEVLSLFQRAGHGLAAARRTPTASFTATSSLPTTYNGAVHVNGMQTGWTSVVCERIK